MRLSRPTRARSRLASSPLFAAALVVGFALSMPHDARAAECGGSEDEAGFCLDDLTFQWCEDGELKTASCPEGQMCVTDNPWYDGAGCVATDETACGDIPAQGECTTANSVVWCDEGTPRVHPCDEDSVCGWDEGSGWYDCLPTGNTMSDGPDATSFAAPDAGADEDTATPGADDTGPTEDEGGDDDLETTEDPAPEDASQPPRADVPIPTVTAGGQDDGNAPPEGGGCKGGDTTNPSTLLALALMWGLSRRRRACNGATA